MNNTSTKPKWSSFKGSGFPSSHTFCGNPKIPDFLVVGLPRKEKDRDEKTKGDKEKKTEKHRDVGGA